MAHTTAHLPPAAARLHLVLVWLNDALTKRESAEVYHRLAVQLSQVGREIVGLKSTERCVAVLAHGVAADLIAAVQLATPSTTEALVLPVSAGAETVGLSRHRSRLQTGL